MNAIAIGPMVFAGERLAATVAVVAFLLLTLLPSRRIPRFSDWSFAVLVAGFVGGRLLHVLQHWQSFAEEPVRALQFWTGGFSATGAVIGALLVTVFMFRRPRDFAWAGGTIGATLLVWGVAFQLATATTATAAPTNSFPLLSGETFSLTQAKGRPVVLNLWATWCPPCRRELPMMAELAAERPDVAFVFAAQGESATTVGDYLAAQELDLEHAVIDMAREISRHYAAAGYPTTIFIGPDGMLEHMHFGEISREVLTSRLPDAPSS